MAGKQQWDYRGGMSRRGDVRYTINWGDKDDQLLTLLHFNCQNKKLVQAPSASLLRGRTRKWAVMRKKKKKSKGKGKKKKHACYETWDGVSKRKPLSPALHVHRMQSACMTTVRHPRGEKKKNPFPSPNVYNRPLWKGHGKNATMKRGRPSANICRASSVGINMYSEFAHWHPPATAAHWSFTGSDVPIVLDE